MKGTKKEKMKIIIDCDPGVDDMEALMLCLRTPHAEILAVTTVPGNSSCNQVYQNTINILSCCGRSDIPIYKGTQINMAGKDITSDGYFGKDGLGNINLENCDLHRCEKISSAEALLYYVNKYPGEVNLVAIGPLTNLAIAFLLDVNFPKKLASLHIMGGDRAEKTIENVTSYAEFNCYSDVYAFKLVLQQFKLANEQKIKLYDFTLCLNNSLPLNILDKYYCVNDDNITDNPCQILIKKTYQHMKSKFTKNGRVTCDPITMFCCLYSECVLSGTMCILENIVVDGERIGHTEFSVNNDGNIFLVDSFDFQEYLNIFYSSIHSKC